MVPPHVSPSHKAFDKSRIKFDSIRNAGGAIIQKDEHIENSKLLQHYTYRTPTLLSPLWAFRKRGRKIRSTKREISSEVCIFLHAWISGPETSLWLPFLKCIGCKSSTPLRYLCNQDTPNQALTSGLSEYSKKALTLGCWRLRRWKAKIRPSKANWVNAARWLGIERVGSRLWWRSCSILF